jgi:hypothetical protein
MRKSFVLEPHGEWSELADECMACSRQLRIELTDNLRFGEPAPCGRPRGFQPTLVQAALRMPCSRDRQRNFNSFPLVLRSMRGGRI